MYKILLHLNMFYYNNILPNIMIFESYLPFIPILFQ